MYIAFFQDYEKSLYVNFFFAFHISKVIFSLLFLQYFRFCDKKKSRHCNYNHVMKSERMVGETINALGADELKRIAKEELGEDENKMKVGLPLLTISFPDKMLNSPRFPR